MIYFDNAATSFPKPHEVLLSAEHIVRECGGNPGRSSHALALRAAEVIYETRETFAQILGFPTPENIVFTMNATHALNIVIKGRLRHGDHVLIGNREHNAVLRPVAKVAKERGVTYSVFDSMLSPDKALLPLIRPETRMLIINHVSNVSGEEADVAAYAAFATKNGLFCVVDASQSLGHIPFSYPSINADAVCAPLHKGLLSIGGGGFLYLKNGSDVHTLIEGGSGTHSFDTEMPHELPDRFEAGTLPTLAIATAGAGLRFLSLRGIDSVASHEALLTRAAIERLCEMRGITVYAGRPFGGVFSFSHEKYTAEAIGTHLDRHGICVRTGFHCAPLAHKTLKTPKDGTVRLSFGYANTLDEVELFYNALRELLY